MLVSPARAGTAGKGVRETADDSEIQLECLRRAAGGTEHSPRSSPVTQHGGELIFALGGGDSLG